MSGRSSGLSRRAVLAAAAALAACGDRTGITGGFSGASPERGHRLRNARSAAAPAREKRTQVIIAGGGIAGLAAARALRQRGIEDFVLLELEDTAGGNSRAGEVGGIACPLGAHYLPVPGDDAPTVQALLEELGLRRREAGRWVYDERHLCHSPQERLYFRGHWQEGLLPMHGVGAGTLAHYRRFAALVEAERRRARFVIPMVHRADARRRNELDGLTFSEWLARHGLDDPHLRWYLDYCCRDEYGAGPGIVSAWAGVHYFAARHGFRPPGAEDDAHDQVLTWPEGNGWLVRALAAPLKGRLVPGRLVTRIADGRHMAEVDVLDVATGTHERWVAPRVVVALPVFVAARVVQGAPDFLGARAARTRYAPWLVANLRLREPLEDRAGAPLAWDNVLYGAASLGYVVATHQRLDPRPGPTVLSWYLAPGEAARGDLLRQPWTHWRDTALAELAPVHPDLPRKLTHVEISRYGHAMAIPVPGGLAGAGAAPAAGRLHFAHSDWAGYSIFEEAFTLGHRAGLAV